MNTYGFNSTLFQRHFPSCKQCSDLSEPLLFTGNFVDQDLCKACYFDDCIRECSVSDGEIQAEKLYVSISSRVLQKLLKLEEGMFDGALDKSVREEKIAVMQQKMRKGTQSKDDFNLMGCWGYVRAKFSSRARLSFNTLYSKVTDRFQRDLTVCSFGGGPGNDIFGAIVAFQIANAVSQNHDRQISYHVFEWIDVWRPIVDCVSALTNIRIDYHHTDIQLPLGDDDNSRIQDLLNLDTDFLFIFSFVALESLFCPKLQDGQHIFTENLLQGLLDTFFVKSIHDKEVVFVITDAGTGKSQDRLSGSLMAIQQFIKSRDYEDVVCDVVQPDAKNIALIIHRINSN